MKFDNALNLAMFSGKGGVGKTTLSCGFARHWAQQYPQEQILLISTDPAHSVGDVLQIAVDDTPSLMADLPNLQVRALDAQQLLQSFRQQYGHVLELLVERGSFVEGDDLSPVWDLSWPGLDELMGILEIQRILREGDADRVVVDMAPSGHTLNLFGLMDFLDQFLAALDLFQEKHRFIVQRFKGKYQPDEADQFLQDMKQDLAQGRAMLQDPERTACMVVAIPEPMSWLESQRFIDALNELQIPIGGVWVNHVLAHPDDYQRYVSEQALLKQFVEIAQPHSVWIALQQAKEPVGVTELDQLFQHATSFSPNPSAVSETRQLNIRWPEPIPPGFPDFLEEGRRLILVGGKGGVGKTTVSAAIAWGIAQSHPQKQIRVISIDPAHSLGDALGQSLGHNPVTLTPNLSGQEMDAKNLLDQFREDYLWELAEMMSGDNGLGEIQIAYGPEAWRQIVSQALPGIDEMLALIGIMELLETQAQDLIILDTAPTGHLLRFLEMPTALSDWLAWIFKLWIKYQDVVGRVDFMGRLRNLRQRVVQAQKKLQDPAYTEFIGVIQNQSAVLAEAQRLTASLQMMNIHQRYIVHNRCETSHELSDAVFPEHTLVRLPSLPCAVTPLEQIQGAARLLFEAREAISASSQRC
ncbi:MAG: ArsA family ATPase [Thainema sp.]